MMQNKRKGNQNNAEQRANTIALLGKKPKHCKVGNHRKKKAPPNVDIRYKEDVSEIYAL